MPMIYNSIQFDIFVVRLAQNGLVDAFLYDLYIGAVVRETVV
jgi:hypothetical protein